MSSVVDDDLYASIVPEFVEGATATVELEFPDHEDAKTEGTWLKRLRPGSPLEETLRMARAEIEDQLGVQPEARDEGPFEIWPDVSWGNDDLERAAAVIRRFASGVLVPLRLRAVGGEENAVWLDIHVPDAPGPMHVHVAWLGRGK